MVNENEEPSFDLRDQGGIRGERNRTPREMYVAALCGKTYAKEKYKGVGFPVVQNRTSKEEKTRGQFTGTY